MQLTKAEEQVMRYLWKLEKAYLKNIIDEFPEPKPATTTVATLIKRLTDKRFVGFNQHGSNREYFPLIRKSEFFAGQLNSIIRNYFNDSAAQFASFFANETDLDISELEEIKQLLEEKIVSKRKAE